MSGTDRDATLPRTFVGVVGLVLIFPLLLVPPLIWSLVIAGADARNQYWHANPDCCSVEGPMTMFSALPIVFTFVLLVSMVINAILLLGNPLVRGARSVPIRSGIGLLGLFAVSGLWIVLFTSEADGTGTGVFSINLLHGLAPLALIGLSIFVFADASAWRAAAREQVSRHAPPPVP